MADDWSKRICAGDNWEPTADWVNKVTQSARDNLSRRQFGGGPSAYTLPDGLIWIQNNSGSDCDVTDVLGISGMLFTASDNLNEFLYRPSLTGVTPAIASHRGKFAITLEPIRNGAMGRAYVAGVCPAYVNMVAANDPCADVHDGDANALISGDVGAAQILWAAGGTGSQWALVRLAPMNRGIFPVALTQTGGSGTAGWTYTAKSFSGGVTYGTSLTPDEPHWGNTTAATIGTGRFDSSGTFHLVQALEGRTPSPC